MLFVDGGLNRVGINRSSPSTTLHVDSGSTNVNSRFESTDTAVILQLKDTTGVAALESRNDFRFKVDTSTERMRLKNGGDLNLISGAYQINGTSVIDSSRNFSNIASLGVGGSAGTQYPGFFQSGQRYLIGIKNTASGVDANYPWLVHDNSNSMAAFIVHFNGVGDRMTLREDGNAIFSGDVTAFSDERLKDNIQTLDGKKALQMRGVSYIRDGKEGSGVIAQEIEKIAPELVLTADDEQGTKSVAYGNLVGYLIEAIKDQQEQIDELKAKLDECA